MANNNNRNNQNSCDPRNATPSPSFITRFFDRTKARLYKAFQESSPHFPHPPSYVPPNKDSKVKGKASPTPPTLNYPFHPVSTSSALPKEQSTMNLEEDAFMELGDVELLERKVTDMEVTVKAVLIDDKSPNNEGEKPKLPSTLEGLSGPNMNCGTGKFPVDLYAEIIAIYEGEQNKPLPPWPSSSTGNSKDKDRNLRAEVLKWNKN